MLRLGARMFLLSTMVLLVRDADAQVTNNVLLRVLLIQTPSGKGTAFSMDIDGRQYLITAKHMVAGWTGEHTISFREKGAWSDIEVGVYPCADPVDIAVLVPPRVLTVAFPLEPQDDHPIIVSQDVYFVGFPYGSSLEDNSPLFGSRPMPLAKRGVLATAPSGSAIRVDALNNPGFSGSPIVFQDIYEHGSNPVFYVLDVVQGYTPELVHVTSPGPVGPNDDLSKIEKWRIINDGRTILRDTPQLVPMNSGILSGFSIKPALDIIKQHPEGPAIAPVTVQH